TEEDRPMAASAGQIIHIRLMRASSHTAPRRSGTQVLLPGLEKSRQDAGKGRERVEQANRTDLIFHAWANALSGRNWDAARSLQGDGYRAPAVQAICP